MQPEGYVPRSPEQLSRVINDRPAGWEFFLFAGTMILELEPLETRYQDYKLEYAPRLGTTIYTSQFLEYLQIQLNELKLLAESFTRVFRSEVMAAAFGLPGVAGDPARIIHLAKRVVGICNEMLAWAERLRGTSVPDKYDRLVSILARFVDQPIEALRDFVNNYADWAEGLPALVEVGEPIVVEHRVTFDLSKTLLVAFSQEIDRLKLEVSW